MRKRKRQPFRLPLGEGTCRSSGIHAVGRVVHAWQADKAQTRVDFPIGKTHILAHCLGDVASSSLRAPCWQCAGLLLLIYRDKQMLTQRTSFQVLPNPIMPCNKSQAFCVMDHDNARNQFVRTK